MQRLINAWSIELLSRLRTVVPGRKTAVQELMELEEASRELQIEGQQETCDGFTQDNVARNRWGPVLGPAGLRARAPRAQRLLDESPERFGRLQGVLCRFRKLWEASRELQTQTK